MNSTDATIFVVDDDIAVRTGLSRLIRSAGWAVETSGSAQEFLKRASAMRIGCVVLDVHMPEMTGPELHDHMVDAGISFPVVFLTGKGDINTGVNAIKKGAVDYLLKPVDDEVLLHAIAQAIERHMAESTRRNEQESVLTRFSHLSARERNSNNLSRYRIPNPILHMQIVIPLYQRP
jgi:two-component system response regulator FixJ